MRHIIFIIFIILILCFLASPCYSQYYAGKQVSFPITFVYNRGQWGTFTEKGDPTFKGHDPHNFEEGIVYLVDAPPVVLANYGVSGYEYCAQIARYEKGGYHGECMLFISSHYNGSAPLYVSDGILLPWR